MSRIDNWLITVIILSICLSVGAPFAEAKKHDKVDKVGKTATEQTRKDINKKLKKLGKLEIPVGSYTDIEMADFIREQFGASIKPKKERKPKKIKKIKKVK